MKLACQEGLVPGKSLAERFDNLAGYGYEGVEIWGNTLLDNKAKVKELKKLVSSHQVKVSTVCAGYRGCLLDASKAERDLAVGDISELLAIAGDLGAVGLIMVPVFGGPRLPDLSPLYGAIELEKELTVRLLEDIGKQAEWAGTVVLVEPLNRYETHFLNRLEQAVEICGRVGSPGVKMLADFFHMSIEEADIAESIRKAGDWIYHIHLADSNRVQPGYGHTDFQTPFKALKDIGYDKYMALECGIVGDPKKALPECAKYLRKFM